MRERTIKVFHCDHCRKQLRRRDSMAKHESRCIYNADRKCGFCDFTVRNGGDPLHRRLLKTLVVVLWEHGLDRLKKEAGNCPGCILAAIVQHRTEAKKAGLIDEDFVYIGKDQFDFDEEKHSFFNEYNEEQNQQRGGYW